MKSLQAFAGRSTALRYGAAVGSVALALLARATINPQLQGELPFATFFAGIAAAAWLGGLGPSLLSAALGFVTAELFFVRHSPRARVATPSDLAVAVSYFIVASIIVILSHAMHKARESAIVGKIELEREIGERIRAEEALHANLEILVRERTAELHSAITEVKRAQATLAEQAALLQLAPDAILVTDLNGTISFWNRGAEATYGWRSDEALGRNAGELLQAAYPVPLEEVTAAIQERGQWAGEVTHKTREGREVVVASRWSLQRDREGKPGTVLEINRDVTERKRSERALAQRTNDLARSNAELQQFAYVASHDLQEPLRMVSNFTQLLADRYGSQLDDEAREFIAYAVGGATRMQALIQDLLAYSRVGTQGRSFEPVDCNEALGRAVSNLQTSILETGALVTHEELPLILADATQMVQLFQNLIGNGVKFKGAHPPLVHVSAVRKADDWVFSMRDNGIGIEPQYLQRIFIIFQRLHRQEDYPGTGIGLALCKKIVERHAGKIWVESEFGHGSTFFFTISAAGKETGVVDGELGR